VDPRNADAVFWSLAYRARMDEDLHVTPHRAGGHGPKGRQSSGQSSGQNDGGRRTDATLLIDATLKSPMPPLALPAQIYMERARRLWVELDLPPLKPQPPWYGYSLGDWDALYEGYAARAVEGRWQESGVDTFARRRAGLTPETPVRDAG
ncbi:MAG: UbiD family decarboxylase, partial [Bradyrhizobiaceae bacterium]|nr:UbiD family decarboxylase [Bradyrhizobiaceae bacterium]